MSTGLSNTRKVQTLSEFSEKLNANTAKELIYPENEQKVIRLEKEDDQFENWLLSVQNCLQSLNTVCRAPGAPATAITRMSSRAGSPSLTEKQQVCKPMRKYLEKTQDIKDGAFHKQTCPDSLRVSME